jgi:lysophospholipase L1-like esterase
MKKIVCHGDSLTLGAEQEVYHGWPALFGNSLGVKTINTGIGGDTTAGMLARFSADVLSQKPDFVIITGGTNDLWWDLNIRTIMANLYSMAFQASHHGIAPIFGIPLPICVERVKAQDAASPVNGYKTCVEKLVRLTNELKSRAETSEIPCIDFYKGFLTENGEIREALFMEDGLHPNRIGHRLMAEKAVECVRKAFMIF